MTARTPGAVLPPTGLSTPERLVLGYLRAHVSRAGALVDLSTLAAHVCLPVEVVAASIEALAARRLLHVRADGHVALTPRLGVS